MTEQRIHPTTPVTLDSPYNPWASPDAIAKAVRQEFQTRGIQEAPFYDGASPGRTNVSVVVGCTIARGISVRAACQHLRYQ